MYIFENNYVKLIKKILNEGEKRVGRNGTTLSIFGETLTVDMSDSFQFPLLLGRRIFYRGVFGEFAAFLRKPKCIKDFEDQGCNYWKQWANEDGSIQVDYGNLWFDFNGVNQLNVLRDSLKNNPMDRRMIISGWNPGNLATNSLPCCHLLYQWYVRDNKYLDMIWYQRSVDTMVGLPSDIVLAAIFNILLANETSYKPGKLTFNLGDTHIYEEHINNAYQYVDNVISIRGYYHKYPEYNLDLIKGKPIELFTSNMIQIVDYNPVEALKFEVKA